MSVFSKLKYSLETKSEEKLCSMDYSDYLMQAKERNLYILSGFVFVIMISYVFYHSIIPAIILCPIALFYPGVRKKELVNKRKEEILNQFKDLLYSLSSSLYVGKSLESALKDAYYDLQIIYPDENTYILHEIKQMTTKLEMNETVATCIEDFATRSQVEDIQSFADILKTCKKSGADLVEVIRNCTEIINEKIEVRNEIEIMISEKKFEQRILSFMPVILMLILSFTTADYMRPIFDTLAGRGIMTVCIVMIGLGYYLSKKVINIKI